MICAHVRHDVCALKRAKDVQWWLKEAPQDLHLLADSLMQHTLQQRTQTHYPEARHQLADVYHCSFIQAVRDQAKEESFR